MDSKQLLDGLNPGQLQIVTTLDRPVFVEAGAGSGKTFTLTRRIVWALAPGSGASGTPYVDDLSQVLVITFTNAAAREIKERVRAGLRAAGMRDAALQVDSAWISTIHSMCTRILKRHALDLGLDPNFAVIMENEARELRSLVLEDVVGRLAREAESGSPLRAAFDEYGFGSISGTGNRGVVNLVADILDIAHGAPGGFDSLVFGPESQHRDVMARLCSAVQALGAQKLTKAAAEKIVASRSALENYVAAPPMVQTPEAALAVLEQVALPRSFKAAADLPADAKALLEEAKLECELARMLPVAPALVELARLVDTAYMEHKKKRSLLDNDDLITLALAAVKGNPAVAEDYAGRFRLVMVDEFQDTDSKQLELIGILSGEGALHLSTVGDAQQSIYRFRGADVSVFRSRGASIPEEDRVKLDVNYRSHAEILSLVDAVCGGERGVVADFMHLDPNPHRTDGLVAQDLPRINLELIRGAYGSTGHTSALLARSIADRFAEFAAHGERPGNMALLLGTTGKAELYIDAIRARGLECVVTGGSTFTSAPEVGVMAALLHVLANPHDTQAGLFPLLSSEMFGLDADDFVALGTRRQLTVDAPTKRSIDRGLETMDFYGGHVPSRRLSSAREVLMRARVALRRLPVADVCLQVVRESGWLARLEAEGAAGRAREANVLAAIGYIRELTEGLGLGPARAAREFDIWLDEAKVPPASLAGGALDAVRIMTVHASKGLEFNIVAVAECWSSPRGQGKVISGKVDAGKTMVLLKGADQGSSKVEPSDRPDSLAEWAATLTQRAFEEEAAEKTRLLYVALTRAREALILGVGLSVSKTSVGPELAVDVMDALVNGVDIQPGERSFSYGGTSLGRIRCIATAKEEDASGRKVVVADSGGSLVDGPLPDAVADACVPASDDTAASQADPAFVLYDVERHETTPRVSMGASRQDVFSYSSAHAQMEYVRSRAVDVAGNAAGDKAAEEDVHGGACKKTQKQEKRSIAVPTRKERDAEQDGAPYTDDADRATSFGSAFHELAQCVVEAGAQTVDPARVEVAKRYWKLSKNQCARLDGALSRWLGSKLRQEVLSHDLVRAEVPFFAKVDARYGTYVEGAIDLLATDAGSSRALLIDYKTGDRGLTIDEVRSRHDMQANFYATVLMGQGFDSVECRFVCVEVDDGTGEPLYVSYEFDGECLPSM